MPYCTCGKKSFCAHAARPPRTDFSSKKNMSYTQTAIRAYTKTLCLAAPAKFFESWVCAVWRSVFFCVCFAFLAGTTAMAAEATLPLGAEQSARQKNSAVKQPGARLQTPKAPRKITPPKMSANSGIDGFCPNPFGLDHKTPEAKAATKQKEESRVIYGKKEEPVKPLHIGTTDKVTIKGKSETPEPPLARRRGVFPGGENTLSQMDEDTAPEVGVQYKMNQNATTSLVVNPQDEASPLPRPPDSDGTVNAAGVYMDVDVAPDVKMRIGGEYCDINDPRASGSESSRGASVGFEWSF